MTKSVWVYQVHNNKGWQDLFVTDADKYTLQDMKSFARVYEANSSGNTEYQIIHRSEFVLDGTEYGWRIQVKYHENIPEDEIFFDEPGFTSWGDIDVCIKSTGYKSYDEAFSAIVSSDFLKVNSKFVWRIIRDDRTD